MCMLFILSRAVSRTVILVSQSFYLYLLFMQLDYSVTEANIKEIFGLAGKVVYTEIYKDKEGESRGFGVVGKKVCKF